MKRLTQVQQELAASHMWLVSSILSQMRLTYRKDSDDLHQMGCVGLLAAASGFDPDRSVEFRFYAQPFIRGRLKDGLQKSPTSQLIDDAFIDPKGCRGFEQVEAKDQLSVFRSWGGLRCKWCHKSCCAGSIVYCQEHLDRARSHSPRGRK